MLKAGTETGSLMNHLMSRTVNPAANIGDGVTILGWTDRTAGTIIKVTPTQIHVREDNAKRIDKNGMSESQTYEYTPDPDGKVHVFRRTKKGYRCNGRGLRIGSRDAYYDYSF